MDITIYSTSTCSYCHALSKWLDDQKITYKKIVMDKDPEGMTNFMCVNDGVINVPFTIIKDASGNETKIHGFDQEKFKKVLSI